MMVLKQRILGAIREEVRRRTSPDPVTIEEQDLQIQACPPAMDSELVIKRAEYDAVRDITVFYLAVSESGNIPPLIVTVNKQRSIRVLVAKRDVHSGQAVSMSDFVEATRSSGSVLLPAAELWAELMNSAAPSRRQNLAQSLSPILLCSSKLECPRCFSLRGRTSRAE